MNLSPTMIPSLPDNEITLSKSSSPFKLNSSVPFVSESESIDASSPHLPIVPVLSSPPNLHLPPSPPPSTSFPLAPLPLLHPPSYPPTSSPPLTTTAASSPSLSSSSSVLS